MAHALTLQLLADELVVVRLPADTPSSRLSSVLLAAPQPSIASIARTCDELSLVCSASLWAAVESDVVGAKVERGWRVFRVAGPLPFDAVGILAALTAPLAAAGVAVFSQSTFDTDYVMVKEGALPAARAALQSAGHNWVEPPA